MQTAWLPQVFQQTASPKSQNSNKPTEAAGGGGGVGRGGRGGFGHGGGPGGLGTTAALFIRSFASSISKERFHIAIAKAYAPEPPRLLG